MPDPDVPDQPAHVPCVEHVPYQTIVLAQIEAIVLKSHNARSVLAPVLENGQRIIERLIDVGCTDDADNATHG